MVGVDLTYAPDLFNDRWETDRENIDKDIMYNISFNVLSTADLQAVKAWRADPSAAFAAPAGSTNTALLTQLIALLQVGTEAYQVSTLILKRTRKLSCSLAATIVLAEQTQFYSTAKMIALYDIPSDLAATLPITPYAAPADHTWGWLPRQANRTYVARGEMEEHTDWVFAAWSTVLYAYVG